MINLLPFILKYSSPASIGFFPPSILLPKHEQKANPISYPSTSGQTTQPCHWPPQPSLLWAYFCSNLFFWNKTLKIESHFLTMVSPGTVTPAAMVAPSTLVTCSMLYWFSLHQTSKDLGRSGTSSGPDNDKLRASASQPHFRNSAIIRQWSEPRWRKSEGSGTRGYPMAFQRTPQTFSKLTAREVAKLPENQLRFTSTITGEAPFLGGQEAKRRVESPAQTASLGASQERKSQVPTTRPQLFNSCQEWSCS